MRRICYISGTRADFGLMQSTLLQIAATPGLALDVIVTGMHLSPTFGMTVDEIRAAGLSIAAEVPVPLEPANGATMARNIGTMLTAFTDALERLRPDIVLLLGDRGEMLAGALAAIHLNIPVAHIHGGERSGTVDEPVRHAISKLSHIHMTASGDAAARLVRMGEDSAHVHVTGAPGLDGLTEDARTCRADVAARHRVDPDRPFALMVFHPVLQEAARSAEDTRAILSALGGAGVQVIALMPNADAGSEGVRTVLLEHEADIRIETHLGRPHFLDVMAAADVMIGNSSAGIIEAASFGTPVINIGNRQNLRERNANVLDVPPEAVAIRQSLNQVLGRGRLVPANVYGNGTAGARIVSLLAGYDLSPALLSKVNGY